MTRKNVRKVKAQVPKKIVHRGGLITHFDWRHRAVVALGTVVGTMILVDWIHNELMAHTLEITLPVAVDKFVFGIATEV